MSDNIKDSEKNNKKENNHNSNNKNKQIIINSSVPIDENHIITERRLKLADLRRSGKAYPNHFRPQHNLANLHKEFDDLDNTALENLNQEVVIAGRIRLKRVMGRASFATIQDGLSKIQIYLSREVVGENTYDQFKHWDIGDIIGVSGILFKTKTNELTVNVNHIELISKSLRPMPEKFHGLTDQEQRYRQRYLDLIVNEESHKIFVKRSQAIQTIRDLLTSEDYLEVETPMMHVIPGGATAKPFVTHHNALDMPLFLRVAPELYLKRLIVGGLNRVFEINRNFRNEGLSTRHNPEFTMVEFYESYANYERMMELTEKIIKTTALRVVGKLQFEYQGQLVDLEQPFERLTICDAIIKYNSQYTNVFLSDVELLTQEVYKITKQKPKTDNLSILQLLLFEETTEQKLWQPTYIVDYPVDISPLARQSDSNSEITERFELFVVGRELANGYSELNDPEDQATRFKAQVTQKNAGDEEAMHYDADYIRALEYGMPHTGGCGIGIDRLVMLLTDSASIRDVILFPQMRLESGGNHHGFI